MLLLLVGLVICCFMVVLCCRGFRLCCLDFGCCAEFECFVLCLLCFAEVALGFAAVGSCLIVVYVGVLP